MEVSSMVQVKRLLCFYYTYVIVHFVTNLHYGHIFSYSIFINRNIFLVCVYC